MQLTLYGTRRTHHGALLLVVTGEPGPAKNPSRSIPAWWRCEANGRMTMACRIMSTPPCLPSFSAVFRLSLLRQPCYDTLLRHVYLPLHQRACVNLSYFREQNATEGTYAHSNDLYFRPRENDLKLLDNTEPTLPWLVPPGKLHAMIHPYARALGRRGTRKSPKKQRV